MSKYCKIVIMQQLIVFISSTDLMILYKYRQLVYNLPFQTRAI